MTLSQLVELLESAKKGGSKNREFDKGVDSAIAKLREAFGIMPPRKLIKPVR